jgi:hypothetical protein
MHDKNVMFNLNGINIIKILNKIGASIEPWGTSLKIGSILLKFWLSFTHCFLFVK